MHKLFVYLEKKVTIPITISASLIIWLAAMMLSFYFCWEAYWISKVGYPAIKWHTHLAPYLYMGFFFFAISWILYKRGVKVSNEAALLVYSILFSMAFIEWILVLSGYNKTYMEKVSGLYNSIYVPPSPGWYRTWDLKGRKHTISKPEYSYDRPTNAEGLPDIDWKVTGAKGQKRVLTLGDSFTEGDGAPYDSSYPAQMAHMLKMTGDSLCYIMNGGVCGSDPFYNYVQLRDRLLQYEPDIVVQSWGSEDMLTDIVVRGGLERFQSDGSVRFKSAPWWEPLYAASYISREFFSVLDYNQLLRKDGATQAELDEMNVSTRALLDKYIALCRQHGMKLIIVFHPQKGEITEKKYRYDFEWMVNYVRTCPEVQVVDLLPLYLQHIERQHTSENDYFWPYDGHHNSNGYNLMAATTLAAIRPLLADTGSHYRP
ncbi:MAG: SGNH/GDSL hydrolase family protein [Bacteroidetes bacterium]|nr:SGNH/GDSL hydrolase family protein [Bacteroidota bacterium]